MTTNVKEGLVFWVTNKRAVRTSDGFGVTAFHPRTAYHIVSINDHEAKIKYKSKDAEVTVYADLIELDLLLNSEGAALFDASLDYLVGLDTKKPTTGGSRLFTGEDVELVEPKFRVPMPGMGMDGEPQYLCRFSKDYLGTATYIPDGKNFEFTLDEIPEEYRKWAVEVEDD